MAQVDIVERWGPQVLDSKIEEVRSRMQRDDRSNTSLSFRFRDAQGREHEGSFQGVLSRQGAAISHALCAVSLRARAGAGTGSGKHVSARQYEGASCVGGTAADSGWDADAEQLRARLAASRAVPIAFDPQNPGRTRARFAGEGCQACAWVRAGTGLALVAYALVISL